MIYSPLAAYAKGGRVKPTLVKQAPLSDPMAQAVAIRMQALLDKGAELENLPTKGLNLPAAYAGDQRSQQALQRRLSEQATGLQDPSRRKFMKQTAATAAKQALPGLPGVGTMIKAAQLLDRAAPVTPEIPSAKAIIKGILDELDMLEPMADLPSFREVLAGHKLATEHLDDDALMTLLYAADEIAQRAYHMEDMLSNGFYSKYMFRELPGFEYGDEGKKKLRALKPYEQWARASYYTPSREEKKLGLSEDDLRQLTDEVYRNVLGESAVGTFDENLMEAYDKAVEYAIEMVHGPEYAPNWYEDFE